MLLAHRIRIDPTDGQREYFARAAGTARRVWNWGLADRWYPSSKLCSHCGVRKRELALGERAWTCAAGGAHHDRDVNAAINLKRLATGALAARTALPEASRAVTPGTAAGTGPVGGGKVTPVRDEHGQQDGSGQEENGAYFCAHSR